MLSRLRRTVALLLLCIPLSTLLHAQEAVVATQPAHAPSAVSTIPPPDGVIPHFLDLTTFTESQRFRDQYGDNGFQYFHSGQNRTLIAGKIDLDQQDRCFIGFRASSGRSFNWSYADYAGLSFTAALKNPVVRQTFQTDPNDAPVYLADPAGVAFIENIDSMGWQVFVRELYLSATPIKALTLEVGSFGFERGFSSEITTFDDDGYLSGERIRIHAPHQLFFDQVTLTSAYFGSFEKPNLFARTSDFSKSNYRQIAGKKQINKRVGLSAEYNWISRSAHTSTTREALTVAVPESRLFDRVRLESYQMNSHVSLQGDDEARRQGIAVVGEKKIGRVSGDFGFASIDRNYGLYSGSSFEQEVGFSLNGDNYNTGIRVFTHLVVKLTPSLSAQAFYTHITGQNIPNLNTQGYNAGLTLDLKSLLQRPNSLF